MRDALPVNDHVGRCEDFTFHASRSTMQILEAHFTEHLPAIRELFLEYANAIPVDLCFQNFDRELTELPGRYAPPEGRLLLALDGTKTAGPPCSRTVAAGCVALRKIGGGICEMKRLYVRPAFKGKGLGRALASEIIAAAKQIGYERMRLDTLSSMKEAIALYDSLGFTRIERYYDNPSACAVFMELKLR
jgi:putative acetyltransferase